MTATSPPPSPWRAGQRGARLRSWLRREGLPLVCLLGLLLVARSSLANHYYVPSGSMEPTLLPGDRVVVDMRAYGLRVPFTQWAVWDGAAPARGNALASICAKRAPSRDCKTPSTAENPVPTPSQAAASPGSSTASGADTRAGPSARRPSASWTNAWL